MLVFFPEDHHSIWPVSTWPHGYCLSSGRSRISRRWGVDLVGGGVDSRGSYVSKILYVKTKELGPLGGARAPRSANAQRVCWLLTEL